MNERDLGQSITEAMKQAQKSILDGAASAKLIFTEEERKNKIKRIKASKKARNQAKISRRINRRTA